MTESGQGIFVKGVTWRNIYLQSVFNWRVLLIYDDNIKMCSVGMDQNWGNNSNKKVLSLSSVDVLLDYFCHKMTHYIDNLKCPLWFLFFKCVFTFFMLIATIIISTISRKNARWLLKQVAIKWWNEWMNKCNLTWTSTCMKHINSRKSCVNAQVSYSRPRGPDLAGHTILCGPREQINFHHAC